MSSPPAPVHDPIIAVDGVRKTYRFEKQITEAIGDVSLAVEAGSFTSIIGPSGCGKSTLLQIVAGLNAASSGSVLFHGRPVSTPPRGMIYVFQQYEKSIFPWRTVAQNVMLGIENQRGLSRSERDGRVAEYLKLVGLAHAADRYPAHLSGGMQQRVAIARALICEPEVLLMDEPFSAVDALTRATLQDLLLEIRLRISLTVLFVTHDVEEAIYLSTHVLAMSRAPARVDDFLAIDLPYPRSQIATREAPRFLEYRHRLFSRLFAQETGTVPA
jgi:NitT/TauT family transport system ATP-binding protein